MVKAIMIIEVAGNPPTHLRKAIEDHVGGMKNLKDVTVNSINISEPREIEKRDSTGKPTGEGTGIYTCFAEVEVETERFSRITELMFDYMPSSVEILEPSKVVLDLNEASSLLNTVSGRMHRYDEFARAAQFKMKQLNQQLQAAQKELKERVSEPKKKDAKKTKKAAKKKSSPKKKVKKNS